MSYKAVDSSIADKVELAVGQLESLCSLPFVVSQCLDEVGQGQFSAEKLISIIESDLGLAAKVLWATGESRSVGQAVSRLSQEQLTQILLGTEVLDSENLLELTLGSNVAGWCAGQISQVITPKMDANLAYLAGLLHDIGKVGIATAMPKSFEQITDQAKERKVGTAQIELEQLGVDHSILGKRLCQKWKLANQIVLAVWLHHSDSVAIAVRVPEARLVQIVQLANGLASKKMSGGAEDNKEERGKLSEALSISAGQIEQIEAGLDEVIREKSELLGVGRGDVKSRYDETVRVTAVKLAKETEKYSHLRRRLARNSGHFEFSRELLVNINSQGQVSEIAEKMARVWQEFYQTGKVCLWVKEPGIARSVKAAIAEGMGQSRAVILDLPDGSEVIPKQIAEKFDVLKGGTGCEWLFEQLDADFDLASTKVVPLLKDAKAVGAVAFEFRYPMSDDDIRDNFAEIALAAGSIMDLALAGQVQQRLAEKFVGLTGSESRNAAVEPMVEEKIEAEPEPKIEPVEVEPEEKTAEMGGDLLETVTEIAAGAAHELNNPLLVISGRAELLSGSETDESKKESLKLIKKNAGEISSIVDGLMSYARPQEPRRGAVGISTLIEESIHLATQKMGAEQLDVMTDIDEETEVFVDSGQVVSALANIICNAVEAYQGIGGVVQVRTETDRDSKLVKVRIVDHGCGMDEDTLRKAKQPFFSSKPAGRKRGMGLAYADRFVQLNGGKIDIASQPSQGTTVTVNLPMAQ